MKVLLLKSCSKGQIAHYVQFLLQKLSDAYGKGLKRTKSIFIYVSNIKNMITYLPLPQSHHTRTVGGRVSMHNVHCHCKGPEDTECT